MRFTINRAAKLSAFGAAAALVAGSVVAAPAFAAEAAPTAELDQIAAEAFQVPGVVAVVTNGNGIQIKVVDEEGEGGLSAISAISGVEATSAEAIAAKFSNVTVVPGEVIKPVAQTDVVAGAGYMSLDAEGTINGACSIGFSAWNSTGEPSLVTAGHCQTETSGAPSVLTALSQPSTDEAVGGPGFNALDGEILGAFSWSQFGGPGNSVYDGGEVTEETLANTTDVAFIDDINEKYTILPAATDWSTAASDDLAASTNPIRSVAEAQIGDVITTSGRTTGSHQGTVAEVGYTSVSGHIVYGFGAEANGSDEIAMPGDSGGGVIVGDKAVGIASGGGVGDYIWAADLTEALRVANANGHDYQIALDIAEPAVAGTSVVQGGTFSGTAPADSTVTIAGDIKATAKADGNGKFSFDAPAKAGSFDITLTAKQGFNVSATVKATVKTTAAPAPDAPEITSPANESSSTEAAPSITGTGVAGATVTLSGDAEGTAKVDQDGNFSIPTQLGFGKHTVGVTQSVNGVKSETRWLTFSVVPGAPAIETPGNGDSYAEDKVPAVAGKSGINGAAIAVTLETANGNGLIGETTVADGAWSVEFPEALAAGNYTVSVTQGIDGVTSSAAKSTFSVTAANEGNGGGTEPTPAPEQTEEPTEPTEPTPAPAPEESEAPTPAPAPEESEAPAPNPDNGGGLAPTGATQSETVLPVAGGAALLFVAGAALLVARRKARA